MSSSLPARSGVAPTGEIVVVDPFSGEVVDVSDPVVAGEFIDALRQGKATIDQVIRTVTEVMRPVFEAEGTKTLNAGRWELELKEGVTFENDEGVLQELLDAGLSEQRYADLVKQTVTTRVDQRVAKQLAAANPAYAEILERGITRKSRGFSIDVRPAKGAMAE